MRHSAPRATRSAGFAAPVVRRLRVILLASLAVTVAACDGVGNVYSTAPLPPTGVTGTSGGTNTGGSNASLTGSWRRFLIFDDGSTVRSSETTWSFDGSGGVTRVVVATNLTQGLSDALTSAGTYTATASTVTVRLTTPDTSTATYTWSIDRSSLTGAATLLLDGTAYLQQSGG